MPTSIAHPDTVSGWASIGPRCQFGRKENLIQLIKSWADPPSGTAAISLLAHTPHPTVTPTSPARGMCYSSLLIIISTKYNYFNQIHRQYPILLSFSTSTFRLPSRAHSVRFGHPRLKNTSISSRIEPLIEPHVRLNSYQASIMTNALSKRYRPSEPSGERVSQRRSNISEKKIVRLLYITGACLFIGGMPWFCLKVGLIFIAPQYLIKSISNY